MEGDNRVVRRRKGLTERLGLKGIGCCGSTWGIMPATLNVMDDEDNAEVIPHHHNTPLETVSTNTPCLGHTPGSSGMNLAAALAAERHFRAAEQNSEDGGLTNTSPNRRIGPSHSPSPLRPNEDGPRTTVPGTPLRMSLMRLLEETEVYEGELLESEEEVGGDNACCVCMRRKKGAAFIPCGHTFCRVCSRELWVSRGCCPLCNKSILEILDIY